METFSVPCETCGHTIVFERQPDTTWCLRLPHTTCAMPSYRLWVNYPPYSATLSSISEPAESIDPSHTRSS